jgi:DNA topoisomerase
MDRNGIGTDATIAGHIKTIQQREYALKNASGQFVPTKLGLALVEGASLCAVGCVLCACLHCSNVLHRVALQCVALCCTVFSCVALYCTVFFETSTAPMNALKHTGRLQWVLHHLSFLYNPTVYHVYTCLELLFYTEVYLTLHHLLSYHITSHHITSLYLTSPHITSHHITSHHITSHHITSHHITSHLTPLHYVPW